MTEPTPDPARGAEVLAADRAHVFHSWSAQGALRPLPVARAEGSYFWDYDGRRYLDFSSQLVNTNLGHQHPGDCGDRDATKPTKQLPNHLTPLGTSPTRRDSRAVRQPKSRKGQQPKASGHPMKITKDRGQDLHPPAGYAVVPCHRALGPAFTTAMITTASSKPAVAL